MSDGTAKSGLQVRLTDSTLRDGSHAVAHQFTEKQVRGVVHALDTSNVEVIEVSHGDGLGGSSFNYGFSRQAEFDLIAAAVDEATRARIAVLLLPGVGTIEDLRHARDVGASVARIATHCTEADVSVQHFGAARDLGMETVGFLMLAHRIGPDELARQARIMVDAGAQCVYVVDSAGALILADAQARVAALVKEIGADAEVGFHGHQNLSLGVANSVLAVQGGARQVDGALCALGAGAGNAPTEVLAATFDKLGIFTGIDVPGVLAAADEVLRPTLTRLPFADRAAVVQGHAGVYGSFLLHAERAAKRYGVPAHEILQKVGEAGYVGGQEDMIIDIAIGLAEAAACVRSRRANKVTRVSEITVHRLDQRQDLIDRVYEVESSWPDFMTRDPVANALYWQVAGAFPQLCAVATDAEDNVVATGRALQFALGAAGRGSLPDGGLDRVTIWAFDDKLAGRAGDTASAVEIMIGNAHRGAGLSHRMVDALRAAARDAGLTRLVAPVRPNAKHRYPRMPMAEYITMVRDDGLPADPWLRVHVRAGGRILRVAQASMVMVGSLAEWRTWTGLPFDQTGDVIVPEALVPVHCDIEQDHAVYVEPNVWVEHDLTRRPAS